MSILNKCYKYLCVSLVDRTQYKFNVPCMLKIYNNEVQYKTR